MTAVLGPFSIDRVVNAVEKVRNRLLRAAAALDAASVPYAVAGGNAVALWVSRVDEGAVRNTQDVDLLIRRPDLDRVKAAMEAAGFVYRHSSGLDLFLDGPNAGPRDAVHLVFAGERVRAHEPVANPDVVDSEPAGAFRVLSLEPLVRIKLTAFGDKDRVHLRDMIDVGLVDSTWPSRYPPVLGERLQSLLDHPEG
ncbi:MAG TPA: hypothetical protein VK797_21220 [Tepidisphaeraceae bacterium]|nr:hypothetical protein [Tepidisphaeraceae bacterium]